MYNDIYNKEQYAYEHDTLLKWLKLKVADQNTSQKLLEYGINTIAIYGVRGLGEVFYNDIKESDLSIACFVDRDFASYPSGINGIPVVSIKELKAHKFDGIVVTPTFYFNQILKDLLEAEVDLDSIISLNMLVS